MSEPDPPVPPEDPGTPAPGETAAVEAPAPEPREAAAPNPETGVSPVEAPPAPPVRRDGTRRIVVPARQIRRQTRRDFFLFGAGAAAAAAAFYGFLPDETRAHHLTDAHREFLDSLEGRIGLSGKRRENILDRGLTFDDDVAEALYSPRRLVRTYGKADRTPVPNNYAGATPDPDYIPDWRLEVEGLASGRREVFGIDDLLSRFRHHEQITRLCCVEGWSAIGWWGGLRFADLLEAHPPSPDARWAKLESSVNLDSDGDPDPYFVSIDLPTARHPQTLLATHRDGRPLTVEHGAPLRLLAPMKLGLKNIKAVTHLDYVESEPRDYWAERGYSRYDGI